MSSCRSTSFYVAPGHLRYFRDTTLASMYDNEWYEFTHRRDIDNFAKTHPGWNHACYVGPPGGLNALHEALARSPEDVELWKLDQRTANGRSPVGPAPTLYALAHRGVSGAGGLSQLTERVFPGANKPLRRAVSQVAGLPGGHLTLSLASALRSHSADDELATLIENSRNFSTTMAYQPVDPELLSTAYELLSTRYSPERARVLLTTIASVNDLSGSVCDTLATHTANVDALLALSVHPNLNVRCACAKNKHTTNETLMRLASDEEEDVRWAVVRNPACPADILTMLSKDTSRFVRRGVAENPLTPAKVLFKLLDDENWIVTSAAAKNSALSPKMIQKAADKAEGLYEILATNRFCPADLLTKLSTDESYEVRRAVAANLATPPEVLAKMTTDPLWFIAKEAASNPSCPPDVLTRLAENDNMAPSVAHNTATPPEVLARLFNRGVEFTDILHNPSCPPDILTAMSENGKADTRLSVAENTAAPPEVLSKLASDHMTRVRLAVAVNPSCPPQALPMLAHDIERAVRLRAGYNPACPIADRVAALSTSTDPEDLALAAVLAAENSLAPTTPHPAVAHLKEVLIVAQRSAQDSPVTWPTRPKLISDLPGRSALPWNIDAATDALIGQGVTDAGTALTLRRLESKHALEQNATYMGNCTAGYGDSVSGGKTVILALDNDDNKPVYNVEIYRNAKGSAWELGQVNSRFNAGKVPPALTKQLRRLVTSLN